MADISSAKVSIFKRFNIWGKLLCVFAAFIVWIYVTAVESPDYEETVYRVPVTLSGVSQIESEHNLSIFSGYDLTVDLTVKGQRSTIKKYDSEDYTVVADISDISDGGRYSIDLTFDMPSGVTLLSSSDKVANLYVDRKATTTVSVYPKLRNVIVPDNYELGDPVCDTDTVSVSGPKGLLDEIDYAAVYLEAGNLETSVSMVGKLTLINLAGEDVSNPYLKASVSEVKVNIPLYAYKEVPVRVQFKHGLLNDNNSKITVNPENVAIKGDPTVLENITEIQTTVIDEKGIVSDSAIRAKLILNENVTLPDGEVSSVNVNIAHIGTKTKTVAVDKITVRGAGSRDYSLITSSLNVTLRGDEKAVSSLDRTNIEAVVDLSGYSDTSGTISAPVTIIVKDTDDTVYALGEYSVQVKISEK